MLHAQQRKKDEQQAKINMEKQILREKLHQRREKKKRNESDEFLDDIFNAKKENEWNPDAIHSENIQILTDEDGAIDLSAQAQVHIEFIES